MTLSYLLSPTFQFTNVSGKPLTDGYVNVYISGTRSKYYAFSDFDGTLHPFNIPLNALGSAVILVSPAHSYDIYVYNSVGTLQMSRYNITPATGEGTVITDVTTLNSKDGTVDIKANSSTDYDLSIATKIAELKEYTDQAKNDAIESANTSIADLDDKKKDKQNELNFNGSATKTVKSITQNANGELNVEFEDIDLPGYSISSSDGSINVSTSEGVTDLTLPSDVVRDSAYTHIDAATANPLMNSNAAVGISTKYAREDHVHPTDTSREDIANKTTVVLGTSHDKYPTDKAVAEFVNSSIATNTANYISNNGEPFTSVEQLEAYSGTVTNNDYAFVTGTDSEGNTYYDRYKATVSGSSVTWALEYRLNNSSFTAAQWSAINSGITSALVAKIHTHSNKDVLDGITSTDVANWNSKQNSLTAGDNITIANNVISAANVLNPKDISNDPNKDFNNLPSDNVLYYKKSTTNFANQPESGAYRFIQWTSSTYYSVQIAIDGNNQFFARSSYRKNTGDRFKTWTPWIKLQENLTFDTAPTAGSNNPVTSDGIYKSMYSLSKPATPSSFTKDGKSYYFVCRTNVKAWMRAAFEGYAFPVDYPTFDMIRIRSIVYADPPTDRAYVYITCGKNVYEKYNFIQAIYNGYCYIFANNPFRPLYINPNKYINSDMNSSSMTQDIFQTLTLTEITPSIDDVILEDTPKNNSTNPITSGGVKTAIDTVNAKGLTIKEISGEQIICFE